MTKKLSQMQAFSAMKCFLDAIYTKTNSDDLALLLDDAQLHEDGSTWDPAAWGDWNECLKKARVGDTEKVTALQAFNAMRFYLGIYAENTCSDDIPPLLEELQLMPDGGTFNPKHWERWMECVDQASKEQGFKPDYLLPGD